MIEESTIRRRLVLIEEDDDDYTLFSAAMKKIDIGLLVHRFSRADTALEFINREADSIFLIISEFRLPGMWGLDLRNCMQQNTKLTEKAIPFIFISSHCTPEISKQAYALSVQGVFEKPGDFRSLENLLRSIVMYWNYCLLPSS